MKSIIYEFNVEYINSRVSNSAKNHLQSFAIIIMFAAMFMDMGHDAYILIHD